MEKKRVFRIDFADSEYKSCEATRETLIIYIISWQAELLKLVFTNPIYFSYRLGDVVKDVYEISGRSDFLEEALLHFYKKIPENHPYKLFEIEDIDDIPFLQVVAKSIEVIKEK